MPLPAEIRALMLQTASWEAVASSDGYSDETYAAAVSLSCHVELAVAMERPPDETRQIPSHDLFFDGGDSRVQSFTLRDRFTVAGIAGGVPLQPAAIDPVYGPDGDVWTVRVALG